MRHVDGGAAFVTVLALALAFAAALFVATAHGQAMTPEQQRMYEEMMKAQGVPPEVLQQAMRQHAAASRFGTDVRYRIVGAYADRPNVTGNPNGVALADVTDRVEIDLVWRPAEGKVVGAPAFRNFESKLANPRNWEPKCAPPTIRGRYEHADFKGTKPGYGTSVFLQYETRHPTVDVPQFCTGAPKTFAERRAMQTLELAIPAPVLLGTLAKPTGDLRLSEDRKSIVHARGGWTWTFTPIPER